MAHTPGPWSAFFYVRNQRLKLGDWCFIQTDGHQPVPLKGTRREVPESAANARLMAAAPELLRLLREGSSVVSSLEADCDEAGIDSQRARWWWQSVDKLFDKLEESE